MQGHGFTRQCWDQTWYTQFRIGLGNMRKGCVLQRQKTRIFGPVGDFKDIARGARVDQHILVALADQCRHSTRQPPVIMQNRRNIREGNGGFGGVEY